MRPPKKIYRANILFTPTPQAFEVIEHGYIVVNYAGYIVSVTQTLPDCFADVPVTDFGDALLIPAMNDMHVHAPQYRNLGLAMDEELVPWLNNYTFPEEARFSDMHYAEAVYSRFVHDLWLNGTMRASIFATSHFESTLLLCKLLKKAKLGASVGLVAMDRNCPEQLQVPPAQFKNEMEQFEIETDLLSLVDPILTPRFIPACSPKLLRTIGRMAEQTGMPVQSHLSENRAEIDWVRQLEPKASCYGDAYYRYGLFGNTTPTLMAHCCYSQGKELDLMQANEVMVVHCPTSNCNLGSGIAPVRTFLQRDIPVALGSDISGGHHLSMFRVMQYAMQMSKLQYAHSEGKLPFLSLSEVFYMATKSCSSIFFGIGSFEKGYAFDALVIDDSSLNATVKPLKPYTLLQRLERFIYLGDDRQITHRFCQGRDLPEPMVSNVAK